MRPEANSTPLGQLHKLSSGGAAFLRAVLRLGLDALSGSAAGKGKRPGSGTTACPLSNSTGGGSAWTGWPDWTDGSD